jgi:hypothetical protein
VGWKDKVKVMAEKGQAVTEQAKAAREELQAKGKATAAQLEAQRQSADEAQQFQWRAAGIVFRCRSHEEGRNATVTLYRDRIERVKDKALGSLSKAKQDAEVIPLRSATSVQAKKDGLMFTRVTVYTGGNNIDFRIRHEDAQQFRDEVTKLLLQDPTSSVPKPVEFQPDPLDQLKKLAELKDAGVVSEAEFEAKKKQLLTL